MANSINLNTQTNLENNINNQNFRVLQIQFNDLLMKNRRLQSEVEDLKKKNNPFIKRSHGYFELKPAQQHNIRHKLKILLENVNENMNKVGLKVDSVNIKKTKNNDTDKKFYFNLQKPSVDDLASIKNVCISKIKLQYLIKSMKFFVEN